MDTEKIIDKSEAKEAKETIVEECIEIQKAIDAIKSEDTFVLESLLVEGLDPNTKTLKGNPIIFLTENQEIIKLLLEYGADPKAEDENGFKMEDYTDDENLKQLLNEPRKSPITKFVKYRATIKSNKANNKTRKRHFRVEKS